MSAKNSVWDRLLTRAIGCLGARTAAPAVVAVLALAGGASAAPQESVTFNNVASNSCSGCSQNAIQTHTFTGTYAVGAITVNGTLTEVNTSTFASEARILVTPPVGSPFVIQPTTTGSFTTTIVVPLTTLTVNASAPVTSAAGLWTFRFYESLDDGGDFLADSTWTDITITLDDTAPLTQTPLTPAGGLFTEIEPNDLTYPSNLVSGFTPGESIVGNTTGAVVTAGPTSLDAYKITVDAAAPGIYKNQITLTTTGTAGHAQTIRGLVQASQGASLPGMIAQASDYAPQAVVLQTGATTPARFVQWYGFGKGESLYYRVTGTASTTGDYTATLSSTPVAPIVVTPDLYAGSVVITRSGHTNSVDMWLYDSNLDPIPGAGNAGNNTLTRTLTPGTYYLAVSNSNTANNLVSPADDSTRTGSVLDFPGMAINSSATTVANLAMNFASPGSSAVGIGAKTAAFDIVWYQFNVVIAPIPTGNATATPNPVVVGNNTNIRVTVTPAAGGTLNDISNVTANIFELTGNASPDTLTLTRDGVSADWIGTAAVGLSVIPGAKNVPFEITQTTPAVVGNGSFSVNVALAPPANDLCTGAAVISMVPFTSTLVEYEWATTDTNANPSCDSTSNSTGANRGVWWTYTPAANGLMTVRRDASPTTEDTVTSVWTGADCSALTQVPTNGCVDSDGTTFSVAVTGGTTYYIMVSKYSNAAPATGTMVGVTVDFVPPLANDDCTGAIALALGVPTSSDNATATSTGDGVASTCQTSVKNGVWYSFTTGAMAETYLISTCSGAAHDTVLTVFNAGVDCSGISTASNILVCNDDAGPGCTGTRASLTAGLAANSTYLVRLQTWNSGTSGPYTIEVTIPTPIDACCNNTTGVCTPIIAGTCPTGSTSTGMTSCTPSPCAVISTCCNNTSGVCTTIYGGACPTGTTAGTGLVCDAMTCPAIATCCNDTTGACSIIYGGSCPTGSSQVDTLGTCTPNPCPPSGSCCTGTACSVILDTNSASCTGAYTVNGVCSPVNPCFPADNCTTTDLIATVGTQSGSTVDSTTSFLITNVALCPGITTSSGGFNDVFWQFTAPATAAYTIDTCGSAFDTILSVHGGTCGTLATTDPLACNDDSSTPTGNVACTSSTLHSRIQTVTLTGGTTYYIRISAFLTTTRGAYTLNINYITGVGSCCVSTTCSLTDAANCSGTFNAGGSCSPSPCVPSTENCCRGTTCNSITAGTCTGVVAGSNSLVVTTCGAGNALSTCCFADYNHDGIQSIDDLFLYFNAYFTASPWANVGGDGVATPTIDDLFLYINAYFSTCAP